MNKVFIFIFLFSLYSCANSTVGQIGKSLNESNEQFHYSDKNGKYNVRISTKYDEKSHSYSTKKILEVPKKKKDGVLEQSVSISTLGMVNKKSIILRPKISQYKVWFDGQKYSSELKINTKKKAIDVKMESPEKEWNGIKQVTFPKNSQVPCFFNQIIECAKVNGFITKSTKERKGLLNILIVWEGYPFLGETFSDIPSELFSEAELEYDGETKDSERRYNLRFAGQSLFYVLSEQDEMIKMFWVSQGISLVNKKSPTTKNTDESEETELE